MVRVHKLCIRVQKALGPEDIRVRPRVRVVVNFPQVWHHNAVLGDGEPANLDITVGPMLDSKWYNAGLSVDFIDEGNSVGPIILA